MILRILGNVWRCCHIQGMWFILKLLTALLITFLVWFSGSISFISGWIHQLHGISITPRFLETSNISRIFPQMKLDESSRESGLKFIHKAAFIATCNCCGYLSLNWLLLLPYLMARTGLCNTTMLCHHDRYHPRGQRSSRICPICHSWRSCSSLGYGWTVRQELLHLICCMCGTISKLVKGLGWVFHHSRSGLS